MNCKQQSASPHRPLRRTLPSAAASTLAVASEDFSLSLEEVLSEVEEVDDEEAVATVTVGDAVSTLCLVADAQEVLEEAAGVLPPLTTRLLP